MTLFSQHAQTPLNGVAIHMDSIAAIAGFIPLAAAALALISLVALLFSIFMGESSRSAHRLIACLVLSSAAIGASIVLARLGMPIGLNGVTPIADMVTGSIGFLMWVTIGAAAMAAAYGLLRRYSTNSYAHPISIEQEAIDRAIECVEALLTSLAKVPFPNGDPVIGNSNISVEHVQEARSALIDMRENTRSGVPLGSESRSSFNAIVRMLNTYMPRIEEYLQAHDHSVSRNSRVRASRPAVRRAATSDTHGRDVLLPELGDFTEPLPGLDFMRLLSNWFDGDNAPYNCSARETTQMQSHQSALEDCSANDGDWCNDFGGSDGGSDSSDGSCSDSN